MYQSAVNTLWYKNTKKNNTVKIHNRKTYSYLIRKITFLIWNILWYHAKKKRKKRVCIVHQEVMLEVNNDHFNLNLYHRFVTSSICRAALTLTLTTAHRHLKREDGGFSSDPQGGVRIGSWESPMAPHKCSSPRFPSLRHQGSCAGEPVPLAVCFSGPLEPLSTQPPSLHPGVRTPHGSTIKSCLSCLPSCGGLPPLPFPFFNQISLLLRLVLV